MFSKKLISVIVFVLPLIGCSLFGLPPEQQQPAIDDLPDIQLFPLGDCSSGCWNNLQPGETTEAQVLQLLDNPPLQISQINTEYENYSIIFANHEDGYEIVAVVVHNELQRLEIGSRWLGLTLSEVVFSLGESAYISLEHDVGGDVFALDTRLRLYYPSQGLIFQLLESDEFSSELIQSNEVEVCISENALIGSVEITQRGSINDILEQVNLPVQRSTVIVDQLSEWTGFGCRSFAYP